MTAETVLYILIALAVSAALAIYMYGYRSGYPARLRWILGGLRWIALFALFLLLINPKFKNNTYTDQKPSLAVVVDNSKSIAHLGQEAAARSALVGVLENAQLQEKFEIQAYQFAATLEGLDSLTFDGPESRIDKALLDLDDLYDRPEVPLVLLTDGNQTFGRNYRFMGPELGQRVYPLIAGDSLVRTDLRVEQLNANRYSFLGNQFPLEVLVVYDGELPVSRSFEIRSGSSVVYQQQLSFDATNKSQLLQFNLPATRVGVQRYQAVIQALETEENVQNNRKVFAVEVIDEATDVLLVSQIKHPDPGALKRSIETNEQRKAQIVSPTEALRLLPESELVVLYQPRRSFSGLIRELDRRDMNYLIIGGVQTDWGFLNESQADFFKETTRQTEDVQAVFNPNYGAYSPEAIDFQDFPPLKTAFGELYLDGPHEVLLEQSIDGYLTEAPMLATTEVNGLRRAIWDGEGFWRWRARVYLEQQQFEPFDRFIGQLVQYLASNQQRSRLEVRTESFYYANMPLQIQAQYFDKNYVFDPRASLSISLTHQESGAIRQVPMILKGSMYQANLTGLPAGDYTYSVDVQGEAVARSGSFTLLAFDLEEQFLNADVTKLSSLATDTGGKTYFLDDSQSLVDDLLTDPRYQVVQIAHEKVVPLVDWIYLLLILVAALTAEWFIRKYNGLV